MEHILITAGGTVESIDGVRQIRNTSTGSLCAHIYEALADHMAADAAESSREFMVHYVVSETAIRPGIRENLPILFYPVTDVKSVAAVLERLLADYDISYAVHGMAVSDFTKDYLIEREALIDELADTLDKALMEERADLTGEKLRALIRTVLARPERRIDVSQKVQSKADLILALKRTPKLIEKIKELSPDCFLVGFKLLKGVPEQELVRVATSLSVKNGCDLVVANDLTKISKDMHEGLLLKGSKIVGRYHTKKEIASGLVRQMLGDVPIKDGSGL